MLETLTQIRTAFVLIGVGYLFPFSAMTNPVDYWDLQFPSTKMVFYISFVFMVSNITVLSALVFSTHTHTNRLYKLRIGLGFVGQLLALCVVPSLYFFHFSEHDSFWAILVTTALMAGATAFLDSSVISLAGCFPVSCQESLQLGVGISTLIGCVYRVITKVSFPQTDDGVVASSLVYFYSGAGTIVICLISFAYMLRLPLSKRYMSENNDSDAIVTIVAETRPLIPKVLDVNSFGTIVTEVDPLLPEKYEDPEIEELSFSKSAAIKKSVWNGLSVTCLFLATLAVWPALIAVLPSFQFPSLNEATWWPLIMLNLFAIMDVIGRCMVTYRFGISRYNIHWPVLFRLLFIPLLIALVRGWIWQHDAMTIIITAILGWTNGWCGSLTILLMNECGDSDAERRFIGSLSSFYLNAGLTLGATVGLLVETFALP